MLNKAVNRASVLFLLLLGVLPQLSLLCSALALDVHPRLWLWILAAALCLWISACFRRGLLVGMPAAALLLYRAYLFFDPNPITELDDLIDKFSGAYFHAYVAPDAPYSYLNAVEDHSFVLLLLAFLLFAYLGSGLTTRYGRRFLCFLGTLPLPAAILAVNGLVPAAPVLALLLFWALVLVSGSYWDEGNSGRLVFGYSLPLLLLLGAILSFNRPEDYREPEEESAVAQELERLVDRLLEQPEPAAEDTPFAIPQTVEASPEMPGETANAMLWEADGGGMDLTQNYSPEMLETVFLRVNADSSGLLYLRGTSYGTYTGTGWERAPDAPLSSLAFTARAVDSVGEPRRLSLQSVTALRYALLPYYSTLSAEGDASVPATGQGPRIPYKTYAGDFAALATDAAEEAQYRAFAHAVYTALPEETRTVMLNLAAGAGLDIRAPTLVDDVANYIRASGVYDLETAPYPSADYAVWFLTQVHRGYCVHFATAATAMYRALGIPARITEGFLLHAEAGRYVDVRGENAHAWVEIYRDGVGWIPVEVTGQSGLNPPMAEEPESAGETPIPEEPEASPKSADVSQPVPSSPEPSAEPLPVGIVQPRAEESRPQQRPFPWQSICFILLLFTAVLLWPRLLRSIWRRRMTNPDANRAAIAVFRRSELLVRLGGTVPDEIQNCAEKAFFSAGGVSREEAARSRVLLEEALTAQLAQMSPLRRLLWRYIFGL